eukprot:4881753-Amphidinium_carterae.1
MCCSSLKRSSSQFSAKCRSVSPVYLSFCMCACVCVSLPRPMTKIGAQTSQEQHLRAESCAASQSPNLAKSRLKIDAGLHLLDSGRVERLRKESPR